ncbi:sulfite exporter TauE/SafE family protein [Aquihabitans sp. G128]|uniref:sulfite exporter TauE/SafE family protein n=1 Tax=Aquihabitans sp. G128 TaxID=2849779 RepID=UPI001C245868|nr:sulfite exporter TauE/SafE family protein [Aquihabitans sp. G128]QXC61114.1 sulfite exporter TauE/SafE family protein [Aquihabitans sp. G128]
MDGLEALAVMAAGMGAGGINAVIGSGSLISFPTLLAVGYAPITANVSNNIGLVPGAISGAYGYRRELAGQGRRARTLAVASGTGGLCGGILLLTLPSQVFDAIVPVLVLLAVVLMALQPRLARWVAERRPDDARDVGPAPMAIAFVAGVYGGYFGAAQGIILLAMLAVFVPDDLRRSNALKNVLAGTVNGVAAILFTLFAHVAWEAVALIAVGSVVGAWLGAKVGRRIPATVLRTLVVLLGVGVALRLLLT